MCEANPTRRASGAAARIFSSVSRAGKVASDKSAKTRSGFSSAHRRDAASSDDAYATVAPSADATASILERKNKSRTRPSATFLLMLGCSYHVGDLDCSRRSVTKSRRRERGEIERRRALLHKVCHHLAGERR